MDDKTKKSLKDAEKDTSTSSERLSGVRIPITMYEDFTKHLENSKYDSSNISDQIRNLIISWLKTNLRLHHYCELMNYAVTAKTSKYYLEHTLPKFITNYKPRTDGLDSETDFKNISIVMKGDIYKDLNSRIIDDPNGAQTPTNIIRVLLENYLLNKDHLSLSDYLMLSEYAANLHKKMLKDLKDIHSQFKV
jgi:hypothetical protein